MTNVAAVLAPRLPPSFDDNPITYGLALFSLTFISAQALAMLTTFVLEERRGREFAKMVGTRTLEPPRLPGLTLLRLHRLIVSGFLFGILLGAFPDVMVLLTWGEASEETMLAWFQIDRVCDAMTMVPITMSVILSTLASQSVDHRLGVDPMPVRLSLHWSSLKDKVKLGGIVLCIAIGVTLSKAGLM